MERVKKTLSRLFNEFVTFRDGNILAPTPTALPPLRVGMGKNIGLSVVRG